MHRVVSGHLVQQPDLDLVSDPEPPVDCGVLGPGQPAHAARSANNYNRDWVIKDVEPVRLRDGSASLLDVVGQTALHPPAALSRASCIGAWPRLRSTLNIRSKGGLLTRRSDKTIEIGCLPAAPCLRA